MFHALENDKRTMTLRELFINDYLRRDDTLTAYVTPLRYSTPHRIQMGRTLSAKRQAPAISKIAREKRRSTIASGCSPETVDEGFSQSVASIRCGAR